ncbi:MAG: efflux RND transporter permease subunit [Pirellulaceae bacterium]
MWREEVPEIAGTEMLSFGSRGMGPGGGGIEFKILGNDSAAPYLDLAAEQCKEYLAKKEGVNDIEDDAREGKSEMVLRLNDTGKALGLDENTLANTIRASYFGEEVQRLQRGRNEVKLVVRYPREARESFEAFDKIRVRGNDNLERPLSEVASVEFQRSFSAINRLNQRRAITVSANVDVKKANEAEIVAEMKRKLIPKLQEDFRNKYGVNLAFNWEGEQADTMESLSSMGAGFAIALLAMYILLAIEFCSYLQPLIIMSIIPFGWIGAVVGHAILGLDLSLFSFFGLIALTGVIVNDSIVLIDFINHRVRDGIPIRDALLDAGARRFRPIMLTSLTTVGGLSPMLFETSMQAQVLIPMAAALIFGLSTGTLLILILVPTFYASYAWVLGLIGADLLPDDFDELKDHPPTSKSAPTTEHKSTELGAIT